MKRTIGLFMVLSLPAVLLVGCGGDDSADTKSTTTATADSGSSGSGSSDSGSSGSGSSDSGSSDSGSSGSGSSALDEFCTETAAIAKELKQAVNDKDTAKLKDLQDRASKLQDKTSELTQEMMNDPSQFKRLSDCAREVADAAQG